MKKRGLGFTLNCKETEGLYPHQQKLTQKTFLCLRKRLTLLQVQVTFERFFTTEQDGLQVKKEKHKAMANK